MKLSILNFSILRNVFFVSILVWEIADGIVKLPKFCRKFGNEESQCEIRQNPERITCRRNLEYQKDYNRAKVVFACSWTEDYINPEEIFDNFPFVQRLTIRNGTVLGFLTDFPKTKYLQYLTLADLNLEEVTLELFFFLENLKFLDLSGNRLKNFSPEIIKSHPSLLKVVLIDNPWDCTSDFKWILDKSINSKIANKNLVQCGGNSYPGKPVYFVMSLMKKMNKDCPHEICDCTMTNIVWDTNQRYLIPVITVNCSDRGLKKLPESLPENTTSLLVSRNNISDLLPLIRNEIYRHIADIYLDYNSVTSIDVLEGAEWLKTFRVFSLKGNALSQLPIYALDNAFEKNRNMAKVYLGHNPWSCDCLFIPEFQHLLIKYGLVMKDKHDIKCSVVEDDENSDRLIVSLSMNSVCRKPGSGINPMDVLSAVFAFLIILIFGKLAFDYWTFKTTGKLPWIVTKMP